VGLGPAPPLVRVPGRTYRTFYDYGRRSKLLIVRRRPASYLIYAVLVFQLAVGMHWPLAQAASVREQVHSSNAEAEHCPEHASLGKGIYAGQHAGSADRVPSHSQNPLQKHDCCRSAGCQCYCTYAPGIADLAGLRIVKSGYFLPALDSRVATTRPDEFFRPPIA
jgi:hypothetical protein